MVVAGLRFDAPSGNGYLVGSDGRLVAAYVRTVSALSPIAGGVVTDPGGDCLQSGTHTELPSR